jgi:hypothetical protein
MNNRRIRSNGALVLSLVLAWSSVSLHAGIPEPDLIWYGRVVTASGGGTVRVTAGTLTWQIEPMAGGTPWILTTRLTNINDQFSFILRVPSETPEPGVAASSNTVVFTAPATAYRRMNVLLDGQPLSILGTSNQFSAVLNDRGRPERIDLGLGSLPSDTDGDGLSDAWEQQYFGGSGANPGDDPDGDGMSNLREYRAGTHPTNPQSRFEIVEVKALTTGVQVRWSSQSNHSYHVRRATTLLASPSSYQVIQANIAATPPLNVFLDTSAAGNTTLFYLIEVE